MKTVTTLKPLTEIQSAVVFRCTDKVTGEVYYAVPSDNPTVLEPYKVTFNEVTRRYEDTCPATCDCKHCRAVREVVLAKVALQRAAYDAEYDPCGIN
jgi:hypothetical protein